MASKEDVGQLALRIGVAGVVVLFAVEIFKVDLAPDVSDARYVDDPTRCRFLYLLIKSIRTKRRN